MRCVNICVWRYFYLCTNQCFCICICICISKTYTYFSFSFLIQLSGCHVRMFIGRDTHDKGHFTRTCIPYIHSTFIHSYSMYWILKKWLELYCCTTNILYTVYTVYTIYTIYCILYTSETLGGPFICKLFTNMTLWKEEIVVC